MKPHPHRPIKPSNPLKPHPPQPASFTEPISILNHLASEVMKGIIQNNKYMAGHQNNTNALKVDEDLLQLFNTIEGYINSLN